MKTTDRTLLVEARTIVFAAPFLIAFYSHLSNAQTMKNYPLQAKGTFVVDLKPEGQHKVDEVTFGKYSIQKTFKGELEATSKVDMLSAGSDNGSGGYVALE